MNIEATLQDAGAAKLWEVPAIGRDIARIAGMWSAQLDASGGPFLFGTFGIVDTTYAPVCPGFRTYGLPLPNGPAAYAARVLERSAVQEWEREARSERDFLHEHETYRPWPP